CASAVKKAAPVFDVQSVQPPLKMTYTITHIIFERLPATGHKPLGFLTSRMRGSTRLYFWGCRGTTGLTFNQLSDEMCGGRLVQLTTPLPVHGEAFLWINTVGDIFTSPQPSPPFTPTGQSAISKK